jgi:predicted O-methyltransferase YrrM
MAFDSDKFQHGLMSEYLTLLEPLQHKPIRLLEIGIFKGGSLHFWAHYLKHPETTIVGLDIEPPKAEFAKNVTVYRCDQNDGEALKKIADKHGPFDLIIDDGAHFKRETENCFRVLFDRVVPGGYYVIEDWAAGYWKDQPAYAGMVELVTDIVHRVPELKIEAFKIVLSSGKAMAFFRRGLQGWSS